MSLLVSFQTAAHLMFPSTRRSWIPGAPFLELLCSRIVLRRRAVPRFPRHIPLFPDRIPFSKETRISLPDGN